jgi:hypothetical protein
MAFGLWSLHVFDVQHSQVLHSLSKYITAGNLASTGRSARGGFITLLSLLLGPLQRQERIKLSGPDMKSMYQ